MNKIIPCIWFETDALEAAQFYTSIFENSKIKYWSEYFENWPYGLPAGTPLDVSFTLCGQEFDAVNGGPMFMPNSSISFFVDCESEKQLDMIWAKLANGGEILMELATLPFSKKFGWVNDRYGVSWQLNLSGQKQKITPYLMFANEMMGKAEKAINDWGGIFKNSQILNMNRYQKDDDSGQSEGNIMLAIFNLDGQTFMAADGGKDAFTEGNSFIVYCADQAEIDFFWDKLTEGGEERPCGWLKDRFGVSWQVVPEELKKLGDTNNQERAQRVYTELFKMKKIDLQVLRDAYNAPVLQKQ